MIQPYPTLDQTYKPQRDKAESERPSSEFSELVRTTPVEAIDADKKSGPSLFELVQSEEGELSLEEGIAEFLAELPRDLLESDQEDEEISVAALDMPTMPIAGAPYIAPAVLSEISAVKGAASSTPLQAVIECAAQGITHIVTNGLQETTLILDGPLFKHTPLSGVKLTVREYSTAPLAFNIHFECAPAALAYLQPHLKTLTTVFQSQKQSFSIQSVDADLGDGIPPRVKRDKDDEDEKERG